MPRRWGSRLAGFVLTGASDDGASGAAAIHRRGGLVLVEDPASADTRIMPDAAIAATRPDTIAPLPALAEQLVRFVQRTVP